MNFGYYAKAAVFMGKYRLTINTRVAHPAPIGGENSILPPPPPPRKNRANLVLFVSEITLFLKNFSPTNFLRGSIAYPHILGIPGRTILNSVVGNFTLSGSKSKSTVGQFALSIISASTKNQGRQGRVAIKKRRGGKEDARYVKESGNSATRVSHTEINEVFFSALR
jgi:hypothetical protein